MVSLSDLPLNVDFEVIRRGDQTLFVVSMLMLSYNRTKLFTERSVGVQKRSLMRSVLCEMLFEVCVFVLHLMWNELFWKGGAPDWWSVIFSPLLCVSFSFTRPSASLSSSSSSSDKTVKIWLSKVWRKRWGSKSLKILCQLICDPYPAAECDDAVTVSQAIKVWIM